MRGSTPGPILSVVNGAFSERFAQIVRATGRELDVLAIEPGQVATPDDVAARLQARRYGHRSTSEHQAEAVAFAVHFLQATATASPTAFAARSQHGRHGGPYGRRGAVSNGSWGRGLHRPGPPAG